MRLVIVIGKWLGEGVKYGLVGWPPPPVGKMETCMLMRSFFQDMLATL